MACGTSKTLGELEVILRQVMPDAKVFQKNVAAFKMNVPIQQEI